MREAIRKLASELVAELFRRLEQESTPTVARRGAGKDYTSRRLVTEKDLYGLPDGSRILLGESCIVTALATDYAKEHGMEFARI